MERTETRHQNLTVPPVCSCRVCVRVCTCVSAFKNTFWSKQIKINWCLETLTSPRVPGSSSWHWAALQAGLCAPCSSLPSSRDYTGSAGLPTEHPPARAAASESASARLQRDAAQECLAWMLPCKSPLGFGPFSFGVRVSTEGRRRPTLPWKTLQCPPRKGAVSVRSSKGRRILPFLCQVLASIASLKPSLAHVVPEA